MAGKKQGPSGQSLRRSDSSSKMMSAQAPVTPPKAKMSSAIHKPLEGGWGWMIVLGCSLGHFLLVGLARTLGLFFVAWVDRFEGSAAATAWVQSLFNTVRMVVGPLVSMLCDTIGCRRVVMMGGVIFATGCLISSFATSLRFLYLSFSMLGGIGAGCIFTPMFVMVNHYFDKKKGIAMALGTMGSGLGTLVLAPLETLLLNAYGHYGAMFVISGLMLNTVVVGALFRPIESKLNWPTEQYRPVEMHVIVGGDEEDDDEEEDLAALAAAHRDSVKVRVNLTEDSKHEGQLPTAERVDTSSRTNVEDPSDIGHNGQEDWPKNQYNKNNSTQAGDCSSDNSAPMLKKSPSQSSQRCMEKKALRRSPSQRSQSDSRTSNRSSIKRSASKTGQDRNGLKRVHSQVSHVEIRDQQDMSKLAMLKRRFAILKSLTFWVYSFYMAALPCGVQIYVIYTPSLMQERGFSDGQRALVLAIAGGCDIAGRFLAGFLFDLDFVRRRRWPVHCVYGILLGLSVIWNGFQHSLVGFIAMALLWGLFEGGYHSQRATIVSEFITREQIASSVGFMIFWQGIGNMLSPTFAGFLKDQFGTFTVSFVYGGVALVFCAILFLGNFIIVHFMHKRATAKEKQLKKLSMT